MLKNVAGQDIGAQMITASDGSAFTGAVTVYVTIESGTQAVGSVGSGACAHEGNGYHSYLPAQAETNGDHIAYTFIGTGALPVTLQVYPDASYDRIGAGGAGLTEAGGTGDQFTDLTADANLTQIGGLTMETGTVQAGGTGTLTLAAGANVVQKGKLIVFLSGTAAGNSSIISSDPAASVITLVNSTLVVGATDTYIILPLWSSVIDATNPIDANAVQANGGQIYGAGTSGDLWRGTP